jgi:hypothetical protein
MFHGDMQHSGGSIRAHKEITATWDVCGRQVRHEAYNSLMPADYMNALCDVANGSWRYLMAIKPGII